MKFEELAIKGVWLAHSPIHADSRGSFREWFKPAELLSATGQNFDVMQSNISISHRGVLRGIHYSLAEYGQGKWITCITGSIWDVVVDIRPSSPTFKKLEELIIQKNPSFAETFPPTFLREMNTNPKYDIQFKKQVGNIINELQQLLESGKGN